VGPRVPSWQNTARRPGRLIHTNIPCHLRRPPGNVLGSQLFLAFLNDLPSRVKSRTGMFADDCLLDRNIRNQDNARALHNDIDSLQVWEKEWQMEFNAAKCGIISITFKRNPIIFPYQIHQTTLNATNQAKYLGVTCTITPDLSWKCHIDNITKTPTRSQSQSLQHLRTPKCRECLLCMVTCC